MGKALDLVGKKIGRLLVLKRIPDTSGRRQTWFLCRCQCGVNTKILGYYLNKEKTISCGCAQKEAAKDTRLIKIDWRYKFGKLRIVEGPIKKGSKTYYMCLCDCGTVGKIESYALRKGMTKSCGCLQKEAITTHGKSQTKEYKATKAAERRAVLYSLSGRYTVEDVEQKFIEQQGLCFYCDKDLNSIGFHREHMVPLSRGGTNDRDNLCLSCPNCNLRKGSKTADEFLNVCK